MALISFVDYLNAEGLAFGQKPALLSLLFERTQADESCDQIMQHPQVAASNLAALHLLTIRRAIKRYQALEKYAKWVEGERPLRNRSEVAAWRFGTRLCPDEPSRAAQLAAALGRVVASTLRSGRLRIHLTRPADPRSRTLSDLAEHTEGLDDLPPHRWYKIKRGMVEGLIRLEVLPNDEGLKRDLGRNLSADMVDEIWRSYPKPVLDAIAEKAQRKVIRSAACALFDLLTQPAIAEEVCGVLVDNKQIWVAAETGSGPPQWAQFMNSGLADLCRWVTERELRVVGLARAGQKDSINVLGYLVEQGLTVEPVRYAGLIKQAQQFVELPLKASAALVVARRLRNPITGYAGIEPNQLGLGEYLDRVDADCLHAALVDAQSMAVWMHQHQPQQRTISLGGLQLNPMLKSLEDLKPGFELTGKIVNLTHFGAFVELGLKVQGLIHLSELSDRFVEHPSEVVRLGQQVRVRVLELDQQAGRISLSMRLGEDRKRRKSRMARSDSMRALNDFFKK